MYLYPLIRINRALAATLIYSEHPVEAIAISEVISVVGQFFNPMIYRNLIGTISNLHIKCCFLHISVWFIYNVRCFPCNLHGFTHKFSSLQ